MYLHILKGLVELHLDDNSFRNNNYIKKGSYELRFTLSLQFIYNHPKIPLSLYNPLPSITKTDRKDSQNEPANITTKTNEFKLSAASLYYQNRLH